jgi:hypothetical protein
MLRLEISLHAFRKKWASEIVRRADTGAIIKIVAACGEESDTGGILYGVA